LALCGCGQGTRVLPGTTVHSELPAGVAPSTSELQQRFLAECARLGIDPAKVAAAAPAPGNEVFDLVATEGDSGGVALKWTERLRGDYDQNGQVNSSDLTALGSNFNKSVVYDDPSLHDGQTFWPSGDPDNAGGAGASALPDAGSGAANWRLARVDGDQNGQINLADLTALAQRLGQELTGYRVYRQNPGETDWTLLPNPNNPADPLTIRPPDAAGPGRPVRYAFSDPDGTVQSAYRVAPYDADSSAEGASSGAVTSLGGPVDASPTAALAATPTSGAAPLSVTFDSTGSVAQGGATIVKYELDFEGDGTFDLTQATPLTALQHVYAVDGAYHAVLRVTDSLGLTGIAGADITVGAAPTAQLSVQPGSTGLEAPATVTLDATASSDASGGLLFYTFDPGDGSDEINTQLIGTLSYTYTKAGTFNPTVSVTNEEGLSAWASASVTTVDNYDEIEPNDDIQHASPMGDIKTQTAHFRGSLGLGGDGGSYDGGTTDWLRFTVPAGSPALTASFKLLGGSGKINMQLFDRDGTTFLATSQDGGAPSYNETLSAGLIGTGDYYLVLRLQHPATQAGLDYTLNYSYAAIASSEVEPNNTGPGLDNNPKSNATDLDTAINSGNPLTLNPAQPYVLYGNVTPEDGDDWFSFTVSGSPSTVDISLDFAESGADLDLDLWNYDSTHQKYITLSGSYGIGDHEEINGGSLFATTDADPCFIHMSNRSAGSGWYRLSITPHS
jgi:PKD repeat protein